MIITQIYLVYIVCIIGEEAREEECLREPEDSWGSPSCSPGVRKIPNKPVSSHKTLTTLWRIYDYVGKRAVRLFGTAAPGNWLLSFVEAAYYLFRQRGSRNSLNGIACTRVKNLDILWRRLSFSLSVAAKSHYRERRLLFSSLGCD